MQFSDLKKIIEYSSTCYKSVETKMFEHLSKQLAIEIMKEKYKIKYIEGKLWPGCSANHYYQDMTNGRKFL